MRKYDIFLTFDRSVLGVVMDDTQFEEFIEAVDKKKLVTLKYNDKVTIVNTDHIIMMVGC